MRGTGVAVLGVTVRVRESNPRALPYATGVQL